MKVVIEATTFPVALRKLEEAFNTHGSTFYAQLKVMQRRHINLLSVLAAHGITAIGDSNDDWTIAFGDKPASDDKAFAIASHHIPLSDNAHKMLMASVRATSAEDFARRMGETHCPNCGGDPRSGIDMELLDSLGRKFDLMVGDSNITYAFKDNTGIRMFTVDGNCAGCDYARLMQELPADWLAATVLPPARA